MYKIISEKLDYWAEALQECSMRKDNPCNVLLALSDDLKEWVAIIKNFEEVMQDAEDGDEIVVYTKKTDDDLLN